MSKKQETLFKDRIAPKLTALPNSYWVKQDHTMRRGLPDFYGCVNGLFVYLELKKDGVKGPERLQEFHLQKAAKAGGLGFVIYPEVWDHVHDLLKEIACTNLELGQQLVSGVVRLSYDYN